MEESEKSQGQIEDLITKKVITFYRETMGVGPKEAKTYILEDMVIVRLKTQLLPIEKKLLLGNRGTELVKNIRQSLHELTVKQINNIVSKLTKQKIISTHSDISTKTGEIIQIFVLDKNYQKELEQNS